ncbi:cobalt-precorrin-6A reductase [Gordonia sp. TBRC 11910]|uniref:Cobalt-precorrin-6A reductase n=1 Tax=Gordonia asplenii TaxID=2725283 RepID=A0A848KMV7_9ACTN|nr:cobalt-precorrin-6A reductase [Gordonia asplenii]NMO00006.1 cobalt-precorrin-6A reductase [Gordonia asplenii]
MPGTERGGRLLILGGTGEARELAAGAVDDGMDVVSSLAGRVQRPRLPVGEVRIGGFGGVDGLADYVRAERISCVVDATHPFAATMTRHAVAACAASSTPLLRLRRPPWSPSAGDDWFRLPDMAAAADYVATRRGRVFLTTGRQDVGVFAGVTDAWFLIRVVDPPSALLPPNAEILSARGPYRHDDEAALMTAHRITTLVTKNSGGALTRAKLDAARELGIEVVMVERPVEPAGLVAVDDAASALAWVRTVIRR